MRDHNKITFAKEYCQCRRIPYRFKGEQLLIGNKDLGWSTIFSVYNFTYKDLINCIDKMVDYDQLTTYFTGMSTKKHLIL